jgi:ADP-ribose pyrophosphatase YjhB (NUDIX family)
MRAMAVCLQESKGAIEVLLIRPLFQVLWDFPGGDLQPREMPFEAAGRELLAATGYAGRVKRSPVAHRDLGRGRCDEIAFLLVRGASPVESGEPRCPARWFPLAGADAALRWRRSEDQAAPFLTALQTAVHWFRLQGRGESDATGNPAGQQSSRIQV